MIQQQEQRTFTGGLDLDTAPEAMPNGSYIDALNVTHSSGTLSYDKIITNIQGNKIFPLGTYALPTGQCITIGSFTDKIKNRIIDFLYNQNGNHQIRLWDFNTKTVSTIINDKSTQTAGASILNFNPQYRIHSVNVLHRDSSEGDLMYWTDGYNPPRKINIDKALGLLPTSYGTLTSDFLLAGKIPPFSCPTNQYVNDTTRNFNNLRKKMFQFRYRFVYDDYEKSTYSPWGKVPLPSGNADPAIDSVPTNNNRIDIAIQTGSAIVTKIEVVGRISNGTAWGDPFLITTLDKSVLGLNNNVSYTYSFFNDGVYTYVDVTESNLLYDSIPQIADTQQFVNGNLIVYGAIKEGYNYSDVSLNVSMSTGSEQGTPSPYITILPYYFTPSYQLQPYSSNVDFTAQYTGYGTISGTASCVMHYSVYTTLNNNFTGDLTFSPFSSTNLSITQIQNFPLQAGESITTVQVNITSATGQATNPQVVSQFVSLAKYDWYSQYNFGLEYFDNLGRTNTVYTNSGMSLFMPGYSETSNVANAPYINASINHAPPSWATNYQWVRSQNLTQSQAFYWISLITYNDGVYWYISIDNLVYYQNSINPSTNYKYSFSAGDRIKIIKGITSGSIYTNYDFEINGLVINPKINNATQNGEYLQVKMVTGVSFDNSSLIKVYTPAQTLSSNQVLYYEFGEVYSIINPGTSSAYHQGMLQNQTATQPATFKFTDGDYYFTSILIPSNEVSPTNFFPLAYVMAENFDDNFPSAFNSDGRPGAVFADVKQLKYPTLVRYSLAYIQDTEVNQLNRFYDANQDEYTRDYGSIRRMSFWENYLRVFQELKIGRVPVNQSVIQTQGPDALIGQSAKVLNNIQYYEGNFGIGDAPCSLASENYRDYFVDTNRGVWCRCSLNGIEPLSILYKTNSLFAPTLPLYNQSLLDSTVANPSINPAIPYPTVIGCFDTIKNEYIVSLLQLDRWRNGTQVINSPAMTYGFSEDRNLFEGAYSYHPEWMANINNLFVTFSNGFLYTHDNFSNYCNFYGVQYDCYVTGIFNDNLILDKTYISLRETSNTIWYSDMITTSLGQSSVIPSSFFKQLEGQANASFLRDTSSTGGLANGTPLKGTYMTARFRIAAASKFADLSVVTVKYNIYPT